MDMDSPSPHYIDRQQQQQNTSAHEVSTTVQSSNGQNINATSDLLYNPEQNPEQQLGQDQEISTPYLQGQDEEEFNLPSPQMAHPEHNNFSYSYDELSKGLAFKSFEEATDYMKRWCNSNKLPFIKRDSCKGSETKPGRILYECPHGTKRKYKETLVRERQSVNYTACGARVNIFESMKDRFYKVTNCIKAHSGHMVGDEVYGSYPTVRVMSEKTKNKVIALDTVGASRRRVADVIGQETGTYRIKVSSFLVNDKFSRDAVLI